MPHPLDPAIADLIRTESASFEAPLRGLRASNLHVAAVEGILLAQHLTPSELAETLRARHGALWAEPAQAVVAQLCASEAGQPKEVVHGRYDLVVVNLHAGGGMASLTVEIVLHRAAQGARVLLVCDPGLLVPGAPERLARAAVRLLPCSLGSAGWAYRASRLIRRLSEVRCSDLLVVHLLPLPILSALRGQAERVVVLVEQWAEQSSWILPFLEDLDRGLPPQPVPALDLLLEHCADLPFHMELMRRVVWGTAVIGALANVDQIAVFRASELPVWTQRFPGRVAHVPPMVDTARFRPASRRPGPPVVLLNARKGDPANFYQTLRRVLPERESASLRVLGARPEDAAVLRSAGCEVLPTVPHELVHEIYQASDWYALFSGRSESVSVGVLEAMACGVVPLVSPYVAAGFGSDSAVGRALVVVPEERRLSEVLAELGAVPPEARRVQVRAAVEQEHGLEQGCRRLFES